MSRKERTAVLAQNTDVATGMPASADAWHTIPQINNFVNSIDLDALNMEKGDVYSILTAVPSPWVRAYMMSNALRWRYVTRTQKEKPEEMKGMEGLYSALQDEFKGLLSCLALYSSRISVQKIVLKYPDKEIDIENDTEIDILKKVYNVYDIAGAFGNMLFEQAGLWSDNRKNSEDFNPPYFQLIHLDNVVIGATSPSSLAYPAAFYDLSESDIEFFKRGRFRDPIGFLNAKQLEKIVHYVSQLASQIDNYESAIGSNQAILLSVRTFLKEFVQESKEHIKKTFPEYSLNESGVLDYFQKFSYPFDLVFNMDMKIYKTEDGRYLNKNESGKLKEFNPDLLLLDAEFSSVVMLDAENGFNPNLSTVLPATDEKGNTHYFALPLSAKGLNEFYPEISDLLDVNKGDKSLTAEYDSVHKTLNVCLELNISDHATPFYKRYKVTNPGEALDTNVILWPNFVAPNWKNYYLYSEAPHNRKGIKVLPLYASNGAVAGVRQDAKGNIYHIHEDKVPAYKRDFNSEVIVKYDEKLLKERDMNYEIYFSEIPFTGVEIRNSTNSLDDSCCGFVLMKSNSKDKNESVTNFTGNRNELEPVDVGIDFGSTNTTATFSNNRDEHANIVINNRRRFILGKELNDNNVFAEPNEIFFFQNDTTSKSIKSALVYHDYLRIVDPEIGQSMPLAGGVPNFERNLNLIGGQENHLLLEAIPNEETKLLYDLKWKREDKYLVNKKAFIKSVWLYINAELFATQKVPKNLLWSFPTSMPLDLRKTYEGIYQEVLDTVKPIKSNINIHLTPLSTTKSMANRALSESEAVVNYALSSGGVGIGSKSIMVGIDIGGVTSDLLVLIADPGEYRAKLMSQSSVKIAANKLSQAIGKSENLRECIKHFVRVNKLNLPALENITSDTSHFLTNLLFEVMEDDAKLERSFYRELWNPENEQLKRDETRGLIAISTYITGLLIFHAGQSIRSMLINEKNADNFSVQELQNGFHLKISPFGKGGKLFDWLGSAISEAVSNEYYKTCFLAGFNAPKEVEPKNEDILNSFSIISNPKNLKMEVGYGLTAPRNVVKIDDAMEAEIVGESGYVFRNANNEKIELKWNDPIVASQIFEFGEDLVIPESNDKDSGLAHFEKFKTVYLALIKDWDIFDYSLLKSSTKDFAYTSLENYVKNDEDWLAGAELKRRTGDDDDFLFSCSPFLYEGMCFLDDVIIKNIYKS
jgi:hypothetical protein